MPTENDPRKRLAETFAKFEKEIVKPRLGEINNNLFAQIGIQAVIVVTLIISDLSVSVRTLIGTIVLASMGELVNFERLRRTYDQFTKDKQTLKTLLGYFYTKLTVCKDGDGSLEKLEEEFLKQLNKYKPK